MKKILTVLMMAALLVSLVVSCDDAHALVFHADEPEVTTCTVSFYSNGGSEVASVKVEAGSKIKAPTAPTKDGYNFVGWYKEEALTTAWDFATDTVTAEITLYAKWEVAEIKAVCFTAKEAGAVISINKSGTAPDIDLECSTDDGRSWNPVINTGGGTSFPIVTLEAAEDKVYIRADSSYGGNDQFGSDTGYWYFSTDKEVTLSGNIMYLLDANMSDTTKIPAADCFKCLFKGCTGITDASALKLPAIELRSECYRSMFEGCTSLTAAPQLPATTLAQECYAFMFSGCTSLTIEESSGASTHSGTKIFTCPDTTGVTLPVSGMFNNTSGPGAFNPTTGNTYYWYIPQDS